MANKQPSLVSYNPGTRAAVGVDKAGAVVVEATSGAQSSQESANNVANSLAKNSNGSVNAAANIDPNKQLELTREDVEEDTEVDSQIALLETQLEIKRMEAKLLLLKQKSTKPKSAGSSTATQSEG